MTEKRKVAGVVDRVEGDTAVIVVKDPDSGDNREVYVDKKKLKRVDLKEGDPVTVEMSILEATPAKKKKPQKKCMVCGKPYEKGDMLRCAAPLPGGKACPFVIHRRCKDESEEAHKKKSPGCTNTRYPVMQVIQD